MFHPADIYALRKKQHPFELPLVLPRPYLLNINFEEEFRKHSQHFKHFKTRDESSVVSEEEEEGNFDMARVDSNMNTSMDSTENIHSIPQHLEVKIEQEEEAGQLSTREKDQSTISPLPESQEISPKQPPTPTPLPWAKLFVVFFMYLCDSLSITSLFPYISFMVADFNLTDNPTGMC